MIRFTVVLLVAALAGGVPPGKAAAQPAEDVAPIQLAQASEAATVSALQETGLPARAPQARTMRAYWHVFIAFGATWLLLFGYALTIGRRFGRLEREVQRLRGSTP